MNEWKLIRSDIEPTKAMIDAAYECDVIKDALKAAFAAAPKVEIDEAMLCRALNAFHFREREFSDEFDDFQIEEMRLALEAALTAPDTNCG